jgi:hypothetical protein
MALEPILPLSENGLRRPGIASPGPVSVGRTLPHPASSAVLFTDRVLENDRITSWPPLKVRTNPSPSGFFWDRNGKKMALVMSL